MEYFNDKRLETGRRREVQSRSERGASVAMQDASAAAAEDQQTPASSWPHNVCAGARSPWRRRECCREAIVQQFGGRPAPAAAMLETRHEW